MSVALLLRASDSLDQLLSWAALIARARQEDLLVLQLVNTTGESKTVELQPGSDSAPPLVVSIEPIVAHNFVWTADNNGAADSPAPHAEPTLRVSAKELHGPNPSQAVLEQVSASSVKLLILPRHHSVRSSSTEFDVERQLLRNATCEIMQLRLGEGTAETCRAMLVPASGGQQSTAALQLAAQLAEMNQGTVTALYVEPDVDEVAEQVGQQIVQRVVNRALGSDQERVATKVILANDVVHGIEHARADGFDLLIVGVRYRGVVHRFLFPSISERLITAAEGPTVAVIRPAMPLASRLFRRAEQTLKHGVPQLDRNRRVALVERVQGSSQWDFDFIALTCLSTLIATLGLMLNSPAVVIGAMLVAPLMTPLLGAGLSLVQGNVVLLRNAVNAVFRGFLLALMIAYLVGLLTPNLTLTREMHARGSPGIFDLLVAFTSGIAAAYAIGRPNLLSALPGVAIAASLVPPISTCGLSLVMGRYNLAIGAGLLFLTNIIAIVLGAACSLFAVGIRGTHAHGTFAKWTWRVAMALVLLFMGLGIYEVLFSEELPRSLRTVLEERLHESDAQTVSLSVDKDQRPVQVDLVIKLPRVPDQQLAQDLLEILKQHYRPDVQLQLQSQLVTHLTASP